MASMNRYVSTNADIKVARSRFYEPRRTKHTYFHGYLQPVGSPIEVLPGDTLKAKISAFIRMSTPIVPFIDNVRAEVDAFFVPKRIIWDGTKQFYGEAPTFGIATKINEPTINIMNSNPIHSSISTIASATMLIKSESFASAFGLFYESSPSASTLKANVLPIRSFLACYNEYYRDENYQYPYTWDKSSNGILTSVPVAYLGAAAVKNLTLLPLVNKDRDLFTSILPYVQKGSDVALSLSSAYAPVVGDPVNQLHSTGTYPLKFGGTNLGTLTGNLKVFGSAVETDNASVSSGTMIGSTNLVADLTASTAVKITDLLYALAYEDFLARCARFGTRFKEYIYAMFGTTLPDLTADVPEYLGRLKFDINVQQVIQTTGFASSSSTELGALGAYSNSGKFADVFTKSFTEPGYLVFVFYTKHQRTYSSGVDKVFLKEELLDYYQPPFANVPDMPVGSRVIWEDGNSTDLGFNEPWWEYHTQIDRVYGGMNPRLDSLGQIWTLAESYSAKPTIASAFMMEDRNAIARVLATGVNGPDYIADFLIELDATRVMPVTNSGSIKRI